MGVGGALPPHLSFGLGHFKSESPRFPHLLLLYLPTSHPRPLEELWGAWGRLPSQVPGMLSQANAKLVQAWLSHLEQFTLLEDEVKAKE